MKTILNLGLAFLIGVFLLSCSKNYDEFQTSTTDVAPESGVHLKSLQAINNNAVWNDVIGNEIKAQGGCIIQDGSTFHWFGPHFESSDYDFRAVNHYTSTDLKSWTKQTAALTPSSPGMSSIPIYSTSWVGRPWVMKHATNDYVMWIEIGKLSGSDYRNRYGVFSATSLNGPWTFVRAYESLPDASGTQFGLGDLGAYHDASTGNAYILYSFDKPITELNGTQAIVKLSSDFRSVLTHAQGGVIAEFPKTGYYCREAAAMFKRGSTYYYIMSETRGWRPSDTYYRTASSIGSTWSAEKMATLSPTGDAYSFRTQHDFVLPITGSSTTSYIYFGDRWSLFGSTDYNGAVGRQAWFPLTFDASGNMTINAPNFASNGGDWFIDVATGTWSETAASSNLIVNGDFSNDYTNWTKTGTGSITTVAAEVHSVTKASGSYSASAFTTTLANSSATNCAAGTYTAKVWSRSKVVTYTTRKLEVYVNGAKTNELVLGTNTNYTEYTINNISVPAGATVKLQISLSAPAGAWTQFDDFSLVKN